jgi:peptidoglycan hydrolase-like protein with peptidoglycan-binding domain
MRSTGFIRLVAALALVAAPFSISACSEDLAKEKARAAAERARDAIQPLDHGAMEQTIAPEQVKAVQASLTVLKEYMGPINGKLDQVTLNALESFQRKNDITADGRFNEETLTLLQQAASGNQG